VVLGLKDPYVIDDVVHPDELTNIRRVSNSRQGERRNRALLGGADSDRGHVAPLKMVFDPAVGEPGFSIGIPDGGAAFVNKVPLKEEVRLDAVATRLVLDTCLL
jgi:hypothetical protein